MANQKVSFSFAGMQMSMDVANTQAALEVKGAADEINRNLSSLAQIAGVDVSEINMKVDKGLQGRNGTFDKYRARAYSDGKLFTVDFGVTDNNPLGMYLPSPYKAGKNGDPNLEIYNLQQGQNESVPNFLGQSYRGGSSGANAGQNQPQQPQQPAQQPQQPAQQPAQQNSGGGNNGQQQQQQQAQPQQQGQGGQQGNYAWQPGQN